MIKRILNGLILGMIMCSLTGCVKFNANMEIKKDKTMDFSIIYAFDSSILGDQDLFDADTKKEMENKGFDIQDYKDENMKGVTLSKKIKNIDTISTNEDVEYSISNLLEENNDTNVFKVKKGLLKNKYTAKLSFDAQDSGLNNNMSSQNQFDNNNNDFDFSHSMMSNMDLSINIKLPYGAKSNNASSVNNNNKELKWSLTANAKQMIEFEFELYNMWCVYILIILILIIVGGLIIGSILFLRKDKNKINNKNDIQVENTFNDSSLKENNDTHIEELVDNEINESNDLNLSKELVDNSENQEKELSLNEEQTVNEINKINNVETLIQDIDKVIPNPVNPSGKFQDMVKQSINQEMISELSNSDETNSSDIEVL